MLACFIVRWQRHNEWAAETQQLCSSIAGVCQWYVPRTNNLFAECARRHRLKCPIILNGNWQNYDIASYSFSSHWAISIRPTSICDPFCPFIIPFQNKINRISDFNMYNNFARCSSPPRHLLRPSPRFVSVFQFFHLFTCVHVHELSCSVILCGFGEFTLLVFLTCGCGGPSSLISSIRHRRQFTLKFHLLVNFVGNCDAGKVYTVQCRTVGVWWIHFILACDDAMGVLVASPRVRFEFIFPFLVLLIFL